MDLHTRWMIRRDMQQVLSIESAAHEFPWCEDDFIRILRQRNCIGKVAECEGSVVGYVIYDLRKHRLDILNLAVTPGCQRMGVGRTMVAELLGKLSPARRTMLRADVRETALPAQLFLKAMGFRATQVLPYHYETEDAYRMEIGIESLVEAV